MQPTTGTVEVSVSTSGKDLDPDGYTVKVGTAHSSSVDVNGTATFSEVEAGSYEVTLSGIAENCTVQGEHPVTVTVSGGATSTVSLSVECEARTGELDVSASTSGGDPDSTGYVVTVDSATSDTIEANGSTTFTDLERGEHDVELTDVADNCTVQGQNPRTVTIVADSTTTTDFSVECQAVTGDLMVTTATTGDSVDADGYQVTLDGGDTTSISVTDTISFGNLSEGEHEVELLDVADNCSLADASVRTVSITAGDTASVNYSIECQEAAGDLQVVAATSGEDPDSTGYVVTVDSVRTDTVAANDTTLFKALETGDHQVQFSDVAENCSIDGENPRTVTVRQDSTTQTTFSVECVDRVGDLKVKTSTTGEDQDTTGYRLTLDESIEVSVGSDDSTTFRGIDAGEHSLELSGLADNCSVEGDNPRSVSVAFESTSSTTFTVDCAAVTGDIEIVASTSGDSTDSDGYRVTVDDAVSDSVEPSGSVTFEDLDEGDHEVSFSDIQSNCTVSGANPRTLSVSAGQTTTDTLSVECEPAILNRVIFSSFRSGNDWNIWSMRRDGGGLTQLTTASGEDRWPDLSPDGTKLVFASERTAYRNDEIFVIDIAAGDTLQLTDKVGRDNQPAWSPDGSRIAFVSERGGGDKNIWVMDADGSNLEQVTSADGADVAPEWSADGGTILFQSDRDGDNDIYRIRPTGQGLEQITTNVVEDKSPSMSPDGSRIAFGRGTSINTEEIYTMDPDGSDVRQLTDNSSGDTNPTWSPDGGRIAFETNRDGNWEIYIMRTNGSNQENLTQNGAFDSWPDFSPGK